MPGWLLGDATGATTLHKRAVKVKSINLVERVKKMVYASLVCVLL